MTEPGVLLNPGPVTLTDGVRARLAGPDVCHREAEFAELCLEVKRRLEAVYAGAAGAFEALLVGGSGTCAVEAMLATLLPRDGKALVAANGVYGERMAAMIMAHGKACTLVRSDWLAGLDLDRAADCLRSDSDVSHVVCVQNETTTGRLNDVASLGRLCAEHEKPLLLDAVSGFGAEAIDFEAWNLAALAATASKCLHGAPGVSFVLLRRELLDPATGNAPSVYLDLCRYRGQTDSGFSPFTLATHVCFALREALVELAAEGGWQARRARYRELSGRIRRGLAELGVTALLEEADRSSSITSFDLPPGTRYARLHDGLRERGFVVYAGQGDLADRLFRIANMGAIADGDVDRLLAAFGELLRP